MKKVYHVYVEDIGEVEGMFDEKGELLGTWCGNDATWRGEYFDGFMMALGIDVQEPPEELREELENTLRQHWDEGPSEEDEYEE